MVSLWSPPGYLDVCQILDKIGIDKFQREINLDGFIYGFNLGEKMIEPGVEFDEAAIHQMIEPGVEFDEAAIHQTIIFVILFCFKLEELEVLLQANQYPVNVDIKAIQLQFDQTGNHEITSKLTAYRDSSIFCASADDLSKFIDTFKTMDILKYLLSNGQLEAYIRLNYRYEQIAKEFWHDDKNWCQLLVKAFLQKRIASPEIKDIVDIDAILADFYFKEKDDIMTKDDVMTLDTSKMRASQKLYLLAIQDKQLCAELKATNKEVAKKLLKAFAEKNAFFCLDNVQKEYGIRKKIEDQKIKLGENNSISTQDLQSCLSLLRPLSNQL